MTTNASNVESGAGLVVDSCLDRAQAAMDEIADYDQEQVDELVQAIGWAIYEEERAREISEVAVRDTGFGNVEDKITKKRRKTAGTLDDLLGAPSVGVIDRNEEAGLTEIAKPSASSAPSFSTNPGTTPVNLAMMAVKGRNAIVVSPSPAGRSTCELVVEYVRDELKVVGAPRDLVQMLPAPVEKEKTYEMMDRCEDQSAFPERRFVSRVRKYPISSPLRKRVRTTRRFTAIVWVSQKMRSKSSRATA